MALYPAAMAELADAGPGCRHRARLSDSADLRPRRVLPNGRRAAVAANPQAAAIHQRQLYLRSRRA